MNMKLSYRDKVIFIVVIVIIVLIAGYFIFIKAKITESQDTKNNLELKQMEQQEVDDKIATLSDLESQLKSSVKEVDDAQSPFMDEQETYQADQYIYELLKDTGAEFKSMELTGEAAGSLSEYFYIRNSVAYDLKINADLSGDSLPQEVYDAYYGTAPTAADDVTVAVEEVTVIMSVECDDEGVPDWDILYQIMDNISNDEKTLYIQLFSAANATVEGAEDGEAVTSEVQLVVDVFSVQHMDTAQAK
jgi:cell division protein FtsL